MLFVYPSGITSQINAIMETNATPTLSHLIHQLISLLAGSMVDKVFSQLIGGQVLVGLHSVTVSHPF